MSFPRISTQLVEGIDRTAQLVLGISRRIPSSGLRFGRLCPGTVPRSVFSRTPRKSGPLGLGYGRGRFRIIGLGRVLGRVRRFGRIEPSARDRRLRPPPLTWRARALAPIACGVLNGPSLAFRAVGGR
jgi:hypothetical protein